MKKDARSFYITQASINRIEEIGETVYKMSTEALEDTYENVKMTADAWVDLSEIMREELEKRMGA